MDILSELLGLRQVNNYHEDQDSAEFQRQIILIFTIIIILILTLQVGGFYTVFHTNIFIYTSRRTI